MNSFEPTSPDTAVETAATNGSGGAQPEPPPGTVLLTKAGRDALVAKIDQLKHRLVDETAEFRREFDEIAEAEDNEFALAQEDAEILEMRIATLERMLDTAYIVEEGHWADGGVTIGTVVTIEGADGRGRISYEVVGFHEANRPGELSITSPMGQALMGHGIGDEVTVSLPDGRKREFRIVDLQPAVPATT